MTELSRRTDDLLLPPSTTRLVVLGDPHGDLDGLETVLAREDRPGTVIVSVGDNIGYADGPTSSEFCRRLAERDIKSVYGNHEAWMDEGGRLFIVNDRGAPRQVSAEAFAWCRSLPFRLHVTHHGLKISVVHTLTNAAEPVTWEIPLDHPTLRATIEVSEPLGWDYVSNANADILADAEHADIVFVGHSHGPAIYVVPRETSTKVHRPDLRSDRPLLVSVSENHRYVVDAGSLARPGFHPEPGCFDRASYAALDFKSRTLELHSVEKGRG